jgi:uncharacterized protein (DUF58 family)
VSPTPRASALLGAVALTALLWPLEVVVLLGVAVVTAIALDAWSARATPEIEQRLPTILARGVAAPLSVRMRRRSPGRARVRQPAVPDLAVAPRESDHALDATLVPLRRGRHVLPRPGIRSEGPLGLGCWYHRCGEDTEVLVYPDFPAARRLVLAVRHGRFKDPGLRSRGPLGLGTEFESIRDYLVDDDIRQVNWRATARLGRPMSNQYRVEQDRDVLCIVDAGRLMSAPLGDRTRLDAALDAVTAVALVCDEVGDRCGAIAFDSTALRHVRPRRLGANAVVKALFDLEPKSVDSDYELAFRLIGSGKRALVLVFTDLLEESAARPLIEAMPVVARHHAVIVVSASDEDLEALVANEPASVSDVYETAAAVDVLGARERAGLLIRGSGAGVIEAPPHRLGAACVAGYLKAKARARL